MLDLQGDMAGNIEQFEHAVELLDHAESGSDWETDDSHVGAPPVAAAGGDEPPPHAKEIAVQTPVKRTQDTALAVPTQMSPQQAERVIRRNADGFRCFAWG